MKWTKFSQEMCFKCVASCCQLPVDVDSDDLVKLGFLEKNDIEKNFEETVKNLIDRRIIEGFNFTLKKFFLAKKESGFCVFLNEKTRLCEVYEKRPKACKYFPENSPRKGTCPYKEIGEK